MSLHIVEKAYPNGAAYGEFFIGRVTIGNATKHADGWLPVGKRKVLTAEMAAKAMLDSKLNQIRQEEDRCRKLLEQLRLHCGGRLPSTTTG